jgi:N-acetylneuraminic acid mutarotase
MGVVVDSTGKAAVGARVELFDSERRISRQLTDSHGTYLIHHDNTAGQQLSLVATSADSTTALYISQIEPQFLRYFQDTVKNSGFYVITDNDTLAAKELRTDALELPGQVQGSIVLPADAEASGPIFITIPGTAYMVTAPQSGGLFSLSGMAAGRYTLLVSSNGFATARIDEVRIYPGETTPLQPVQLSYDTSGIPTIEPQNVQYTYDTLSGVATLWWDASPLADVVGYDVVIYDENNTLPKSELVYTTSFRDTIFADRLAQDTIIRTYQIKYVDRDDFRGPKSDSVTIQAPPPSVVIPTFQWSTTPSSFDSLTVGDSILVELLVSCSGRGIRNLELNQPGVHWDYQGDEHAIQASVSITLTTGEPITLYAKVEDDGGQLWYDTTILTTEGLRPHNKLEDRAPLNVARRHAAAAALGGSIYVAGGAFDQLDVVTGKSMTLATNSFERYNPITNRWSQLRNKPTARCNAQMVGSGKKIYLLGGITIPDSGKLSDLVEVYDTTTGKWTPLPPMPSVRIGFSAALINDTIVILGGYLGKTSEPALAIDAFCTSTNQWSTRQATLSQGRKHHAMVVHDGIVYLMGGLRIDSWVVDVSEELSSVEGYNPLDDRTFELPTMQLDAPVFNAAAASVNGTIYMCGGVEQLTDSQPLAQLSKFNNTDQQWQETLTLPQPVQGSVAVTLNGELYIIGGASRVSDAQGMGQLSTVYRYNP